MSKMIEINVTVPRQIKILVPQQLFEEFEQMAQEQNLSDIITEALTEELKKMRFRADLRKVSNSKVATNAA